MGSTSYKTRDTLLEIVEDQFHADGQDIVAVSLGDGRTQGVALRIDLNRAAGIDPRLADLLRETYIADATSCVTVGMVVLVDGWRSPVPERTVTVKVLAEWMGPYHHPRGDFLLDRLSPVRGDAHPAIADSIATWRECCAEKMPPIKPLSPEPATLLV